MSDFLNPQPKPEQTDRVPLNAQATISECVQGLLQAEYERQLAEGTREKRIAALETKVKGLLVVVNLLAGHLSALADTCSDLLSDIELEESENL